MARPAQVSTRTPLGRQGIYLNAATFLRLNTATADTKVVLAGCVPLRTAEDLNEQRSSSIRIPLRLSSEARDAVAAPKASERRLRSYVVWQRIHEVRQSLVADVRRRGSYDARGKQERGGRS
jgi:hypothetical protein